MSRLAILMVMTAFAVVMAQDPAVPRPAGPSTLPPTQMVASIDSSGQLRLTSVQSPPNEVPGGRESTIPAPPLPGEKTPGKAKIKTTSLLVTTVELEAKYVTAYGPDGRAIPADKLAGLLAKERAVLVATDGKKVDPFLLQLYKEDTIVLVPPANAVTGGGGAAGTVPSSVAPVFPPDPFDKKDAGLRDKKK